MVAAAVWLVLSAVLLASCSASNHTTFQSSVDSFSDQYRFSTQLGDNYHIFWSFDTATERIDFAVIVGTTGWVGFGLSPNGQMPRSDVVIGWVDDVTGQAYFHDRYALGRFTPPIDQEQNWFLISAMQQDGYTTLIFWRNFTSCDEQDMTITSGTSRIVGSYNDQDPATEFQERLPYHTFRQSRSINLLKGISERIIPSDSNSFTIRNTNYSVPEADTTYYCSIHYLPYLIHDVDTLKDPIYLYKIAPLIPEQNRPFVHHMLVFICPRDSTVETDGICDEIANSFFGCFGGQIISAWAVGGENYTFPEDVAFPLGGNDRPFKIMLEVHYDNPGMVNGIVDSSGIQFFYTKQKPVHEAGGISVAQPIVPLMIVPPNADRFKHHATCLPSCTDRYLPDDGITVFATFLHTHLIGRALNVRHFRRDQQCGAIEELPPIDSNPSYDFDYQQLSNLPKTLKVYKGDSIQVQCFYNSKSRDKITTGGESTREEMCQALLYYYPRTELTNCGSFPEPDSAHRPFLEDMFPNDPSKINPILDSLYNDDLAGIRAGFDFNWSPGRIQKFQVAMDTASFEREFCSDERNSSGVGTPSRPAFKRADCPYVEPDRCTGPPAEALAIPCCDRISDINNGDDEEDDHDDGGVGGLGAVNVTQPTPSTSPTTPSGAATVLHSAPLMMALMGMLISYTMMSFILGA